MLCEADGKTRQKNENWNPVLRKGKGNFVTDFHGINLSIRGDPINSPG